MADLNSTDSMLGSLVHLDEMVLEASMWAATASDLAGDAEGAPGWPYLVRVQLGRIEEAVAVVQRLVRAKGGLL